ncbi:MAG: hypothetical protein CM15mP130_1070 [Verrucomicrobiota bacterium]|nr:MAG: hypothetical protein CM15mP130_1070 [Verrucomicrobiota bacterium]
MGNEKEGDGAKNSPAGAQRVKNSINSALLLRGAPRGDPKPDKPGIFGDSRGFPGDLLKGPSPSSWNGDTI